MTKGRLEAFSDGVIAIIITIMVLELRPPATGTFEGLHELLPDVLAYALSFVFLGIYWNNHHHMLHAASRVNGAALWANLHLLFWLSMVPFATAWMGRHPHEAAPVVVYACIMLMAGFGYTILQQRLIRAQAEGSQLARAIGNDVKGKLSLACYAASIPLAFVLPVASYSLFVLVALIWLVPDPRIERELHRERLDNGARLNTED